MKLIATSDFRRSDNRQPVSRGKEFEVSDAYGRQLKLSGVAVSIVGGEMKPARREAATGTADPSNSPQNGGQTGGETDASLSAPVRQPRTRTSQASADDADASQLTTRGGSRRGRKSSTGATSHGGKNTRASRNSKG